MAKVNLEEIVALFLESSNLGKAEYSKVYQLGIAGIKSLTQDVTGGSKQYDIKLNKNLTGKLPDDFLNEVAVYVSGDCRAGLLKDNTLGRYEEDDYEDCDYGSDYGDLDLNEGSRYGTSGIDWIGRYKIDRTAGRIIVNPDFCYSGITLIYVAKELSTKDGEWFVDELAKDALESYIRWKFSLDKRSIGPYEKRMYEQQWKKEKRLAKIRMKNLTRGQIRDMAHSGNRFKAKF